MKRKRGGLRLAGLVALAASAPIVYGQYGFPQAQQSQYPQNAYPQGAESQQYPQAGYPQQYGAPQQYPVQQQYGAPEAGGYGQPQNGQPYPQNGGDVDVNDPERGVARVSIAQGDVNIRRGDTGALVAAVVNAPLMGQDHLQTSDGSRAEVEFDYGNLVRLAPDTDLVFADVEYHRYQIQLAAGTIIYRVLRNANSQSEIDTPSIAVHPTQLGEYRISVMPDGTTQVSVRSGALEIYSPQGTQNLGPGQAMLVRGSQQSPEFEMVGVPAPDQFDGWSEQRDSEMLASRSYQHVNPEIYGADDLDQYGNWVPSQYGQVWAPQPPTPDWTPYSDGEWVSEPYYGWTWVDDAPWGWAPFHYGSWFWNGGVSRWCWFPGGIAGGLFWRPAVVGFFGLGGGGFGLGFGLGGFNALGWVALAPFEAFHAWFGHGGGYYNIDRNFNVLHGFRNASFRGAVRTGPMNSFGGPQRFGIASRQELTNAAMFRGGLPVTASRASMQFSNRQAVGNSRFNGLANRSFFEHSRPGQTRNASFASRSSSGAFGNRGFTQSSRAENSRAESGFQQSRAGGSQSGGWQHFG
ncbi:MAG: FecR family protein, partial [Bryobacteraceae bacterium]